MPRKQIQDCLGYKIHTAFLVMVADTIPLRVRHQSSELNSWYITYLNDRFFDIVAVALENRRHLV